MDRSISCLAVLAMLAVCAGCSRGSQSAVSTNPGGNGPQVVLWGPPSSFGGDGGAGGAGGM